MADNRADLEDIRKAIRGADLVGFVVPAAEPENTDPRRVALVKVGVNKDGRIRRAPR